MTAGAGIQHSEMFPLLNKENENTLKLFQIWLNLPKANKLVKPHFTMLWKDSIPRYVSKDEEGKVVEIDIIAGKIGDVKSPPPPPDSWAADPNNDVAIWIIKMEKGAKWVLPVAEQEVNRDLYFFKGSSIDIEGQTISPNHGIELHADQELILENGDEESKLLMLQGRPINEPVAQHGPFVMNTRSEIQQAFRDYQKTQFGGWPWPSSDPVHPRTSWHTTDRLLLREGARGGGRRSRSGALYLPRTEAAVERDGHRDARRLV